MTLTRAALCLALTLPLLAGAPAHSAGAPEAEALSLINAERARAGCPALKPEPRLMAAATGHAKAMAWLNFFGHVSPDGAKFTNRIKAQGYRVSRAAENIAAGQASASEVVAGWMASAGHRKNILNCKLRETGIAVAYQRDDAPLPGQSYAFRYYWVQVFAGP